jgi:phosphoserine phosphatase
MSEKATRGVLFVDLDGTLVLENSFHTFLRAAWTHGGTRLRSQILLAVSLRATGGGSNARVAMKRRVLSAFCSTSPVRQDRIVTATLARMRMTLSSPVMATIDGWRADGGEVVLATAAPDCYARPLAEELELADCLATPSRVGPSWRELSGSAKAEACRRWLGLREDIADEIGVVTDHRDDVDLLRLANRAIVQGSTRAFMHIASALGPDVDLAHLDTVSGQDGGGIWLWFDGRPSGPHDRWETKTIMSKHRYALMYTGEGRWEQLRPHTDLAKAVRRVDCPGTPSVSTQMTIAFKRKVIREQLGIFH